MAIGGSDTLIWKADSKMRDSLSLRSRRHHSYLTNSPACLQDAFDDIAGLAGLVTDADQTRAFGRIPVRPEILGEPLGRQIDDTVGGC